MTRFADKTVLVTGAAKRLGRSIALALAAGGWQVAVHYRSSAQDAINTVAECARLTSASAHFEADFEDEAAVRGLNGKSLGGRDVNVNIARPMESRPPRSGGYGDARRSY